MEVDQAPAETPVEDGGVDEAADAATAQFTEADGQVDDIRYPGQDYIEPYLEGVDDYHRGVVAEKLEAYRKDSDRNIQKHIEKVNSKVRKYEQYGNPEQIEFAVSLVRNLVDDPIATIDYLADQFKADFDRDLRNEIVSKWATTEQTTPEQMQDPAEQPPSTEAPLTRAEVEQLLQQQRQQEAEEAHKAQQMEQARAQVDGWLAEASKSVGVDLSGNAALKQAVVMQANELVTSGQAPDGKTAIRLSVEALTNTFKKKPTAPTSKEPKVADGGRAPGIPKPDLSDATARRDYMMSLIGSGG